MKKKAKQGLLKFPKISFVMCTYNGISSIDACLKSVFNQDYPISRIQIVIADAGSTDGTLDIIRKYQKNHPKNILLFNNKEMHVDGKGMGLDQAFAKADKKAEFIAQIFQDNILIDRGWIKKMIYPMLADKKISATQSLLASLRKDNLINRYLAAVGMEDPFAAPYALTSQVKLHPEKFEYNKGGRYYSVKLSRKKFLYGGNNGCIVRAKDFWTAGGYVKDTEEFYRFAIRGYKVAVPAETKLYHITAENFKHFLLKRGRYILLFLRDNYEDRYFNWFDFKKGLSFENGRFVIAIASNLLIIPRVIESIEMFMKKKEAVWLCHPLFMFAITIDYMFSLAWFRIKRLFSKSIRIDMSKQTIKQRA